MKLVAQTLNRDSSGTITVVPQDREDLWTLYNLVQANDLLHLKTYRNVKPTPQSKSQQKLLTLHLKVHQSEFIASEGLLRIKCQTTQPHDLVPLNSFHTAEVLLNYPVTIEKDEWDPLAMKTVTDACDIDAKAEMGALVFEEGVGHVCLITENMTIIKNKIDKSIPKKRRGDSSGHDKAMVRFLDMLVDSTLRNLDLKALKAIVVAAPGIWADKMVKLIVQRLEESGDKELARCRDKFVAAKSSSGYLQGLEEAMKSPELKKRLQDTKVQRNVILFDEFMADLNLDNGKAYYGEKDVTKAMDLGPGTIKSLLVSDKLFKNDDVAIRKKYIDLVQRVENEGGEVSIFSSLHDSGKQLDGLTGIACVLQYPAYGLDDDEDEEEEEEEEFVED